MQRVFSSLAGIFLFAKPAFATNLQIPVPEPSTLGLLAVGVAGVLIAARLRNRK